MHLAFYLSVLIGPVIGEAWGTIIGNSTQLIFHHYIGWVKVNELADPLTFLTIFISFYLLEKHHFNFKESIAEAGNNLSILKTINWIACALTFAAVSIEVTLEFDLAGALILYLAWGIIAVIVLFSILEILKQNKQYLQASVQKAEIKQIQEYSARLEEANMNLRKARHDYKNSLLSLNGYLLDNDVLAAQKYLNKLVGENNRLQNANETMTLELANLKVKELKYLLIDKLQQAQNQGIHVKAEINKEIDHFPENIVTLIRCTGILLDNAIEACQNQTGPYINVLLTKYTNNSYSFVIQNSITKEIDIDEVLKPKVTSKKNHQGLGLANLNEIVNNDSNLSLEIGQNEKEITFELVIQKE